MYIIQAITILLIESNNVKKHDQFSQMLEHQDYDTTMNYTVKEKMGGGGHLKRIPYV